jgi:hypothetical protein
MTSSRRKMREASRSLAIAFNIGRVQEALYRSDAGEPLEADTKELFEQLARLFAEATRGLEWTQATIEGAATEDELGDSRALRSLNLVLPILRRYAVPPLETLSLLAKATRSLSAGEHLDPTQRQTFDAALGDLASHAGSRLDDALEDGGASVALSPLPDLG